MARKRKSEALDDDEDDEEEENENENKKKKVELLSNSDEVSSKINAMEEKIEQLSDELSSKNDELVKLRKELRNHKEETTSKINELGRELEKSVDEVKTLSSSIHNILDTMMEKHKYSKGSSMETSKTALMLKEEFLNSNSVNVGAVNDKITLDIGGKIFTTSRSTLLSKPGTYFHHIVNAANDPNQTYFIDRDNSLFPLILNYLRDGSLAHFSLLGKEHMHLLKMELDFYQISVPGFEPELPLYFDASRSPNIAIYYNNNLTVKFKSISTSGFECIIGSMAVDRYTIRVDEDQWLRIGFILDNKKFKENLTNEEYVQKYTLSNFNGNLYGIGHGKSYMWNSSAAKFVAGDFITVIKDGPNIYYERNKYSLGIAWTDVPLGPLFPFISNGVGTAPSCTLIHNY